MEWVVTTARTVAEAKEAALDELGVDEADAEFEILEEPRQGLFGRQRGEARVRARVRPTSPRPKVERRSRAKKKPADETVEPAETPASNTRSKGSRSRSRGAASSEAPAAASATAVAEPETDETPPAVRGPRRRPAKALPADVAEAVAAAANETLAEASGGGGSGADGSTRRRPSRGGSGRGPANGRNGDPTGRPPASAAKDGGAAVPEEELSMEEQGRIAEQFVVGLLERFKAPAQTSVREVDEDTVEIEVNGSELGLLIGPKGQTLQAVQELTRTVVQRKSVARTGRIHVDIAGYRSKRREALERFTTQVANDVVATGVQRVLEPMSAADRKVVHDTANEIDGVRTVSEGEDPRRRVVIIPETAAAEGS